MRKLLNGKHIPTQINTQSRTPKRVLVKQFVRTTIAEISIRNHGVNTGLMHHPIPVLSFLVVLCLLAFHKDMYLGNTIGWLKTSWIENFPYLCEIIRFSDNFLEKTGMFTGK